LSATSKRPLNPKGRTGLAGRGLLYRWGPNHAVDPIITRWKRDHNGAIVERANRPVLEFIAVKRQQGLQEWALPGGFIHQNESVEKAMKRILENKVLKSPDVKKNFDAASVIQELIRSDGKLIEQTYIISILFGWQHFIHFSS